MAEHDPKAFEDLFDAEPNAPTEDETARWVDLYTGLVELLERQLAETQRFAESVPESLREYLSRENVKILVEELEIFRERLAHWRRLVR